jgi:GH24 family phage-related lysozyme (muramidase)
MSDAAITQSEADEWFAQILQRDFWEPLQTVPFWQETGMGEGIRSALLSFAYNTGYVYGHKDFNRLNGALKNRNWNDLGKVLILYRNPGSDSELGLARRRYGEYLLARGITAVNAKSKAWGMKSVEDILKVLG